MYEYSATLLKVVDGDTLDLSIDLGFGIHYDIRVRLLGINAPERYTDDGKVTSAYVMDRLKPLESFMVRTEKDKKEKYGRYLCTVFIGDENLNSELIEKGLAKPY